MTITITEERTCNPCTMITMIEDHITPKPPKKNRRVFAKSYKCCVCGNQAAVFWPVIDPDIPSHAYCRPCCEKEQLKLLEMITKKKNRISTRLNKKTKQL